MVLTVWLNRFECCGVEERLVECDLQGFDGFDEGSLGDEAAQPLRAIKTLEVSLSRPALPLLLLSLS